jgi:cytochrome c553
MKWWWLAALPIVGALGVASGVVPVGASSGHWAITNWFLHTAMRRSVNTHARSVELPPIKDWMALKGAGHYETGCRPCHGAPDLKPPIVPAAMTPHPPALSAEAIAAWSDRELFYIVKHGVKFTAMPAWPSQQRDDEIAAMVAFLRVMPKLDAAGYRRMAGTAAEADPVDALASSSLANCARCHGAHGEGRENAAFPKLAGQKLAYQLAALDAYATGARASGIMQPVAAALDREQRHALSDYYARQPTSSGPAAPSSAGEQIAQHGIPARGVPPCAECHGPNPGPRSHAYPRLAGQHADYLSLQLELFQKRKRGGSAYAHLMFEVVDRLTPEDVRAVAQYYASLRE